MAAREISFEAARDLLIKEITKLRKKQTKTTTSYLIAQYRTKTLFELQAIRDDLIPRPKRKR